MRVKREGLTPAAERGLLDVFERMFEYRKSSLASTSTLGGRLVLLPET